MLMISTWVLLIFMANGLVTPVYFQNELACRDALNAVAKVKHVVWVDCYNLGVEEQEVTQ